MSINVIKLASPVHNKKNVEESLKFFSDFLINEFDAKFVDECKENEFTVVWNMTGGTEGIFKKIYKNLRQPIIVLTTDLINSLPAALEILSFIKSQNGKGYIIHGDLREIACEIKKYYKFFTALKKIKEAKIASIGGASEWLIASSIDYIQASKKWGTSFIDIPIDELYNILKNCHGSYDGYFDRAIEVVEPSNEDIRGVHLIYLALKKIIEERKLDAISLKCFDLLKRVNNSSCLALSRLNDEGIIAGCEGDLPATFTMYLVLALTQKKSFMANPSKIDFNKNTIIFAHCTVPTTLVKQYKLRSHFESGIGVGIAGEFEKETVTVVKIGGKNLDKIFVTTGRIISNPTNDQRCRTQIEVEMDNDVREFLKNPIGNHMVIVRGNIKKELNEFMEYVGF
ncbi:L-fucose isomerase-like protein [Thermoanaerobacter mathranii subsp. mathranii str. A3]|uniref:L-fucose isomerase-like protein n=1 Tax=Thermoanaerobacter mathranii subsp. mathranii (strain DSM 11426 / CCUG 53645 / CIP 108742 / A3) TaxID=583358 RepID=A0ABM5LND2_THEM3|nr:fucose isomerase [Thermoanaerobacter mathranii]ADH60270.1 L-fucose isomerase-like protein [Thermoanaerobacter mathranii subsp. mathranii str. A3]